MLAIRESKDAISFAVQVKPRASQNSLAGTHGEALAVRLTAPPVDGAANAALCLFLAKLFGVPTSHVEIVAGQTGKHKVVKLYGLTKMAAEEILQPLLAAHSR